MKIYAKTIDTWVTRTPVPPEPLKPGDKAPGKPGEPPAPGVKYQLDRAHCEDDTEVVVHQDPTDPTKPRGVDILGRVLIIDGSPFGNVMRVFGWPVAPGKIDARPGEVHREDMSLLGPEVVLDQVHNASSVRGRGALKMPANSDLSGGELAQPQEIVVHWRDSMKFEGAKRSAQFEGKVFAKQGESWILCHQMNVLFDRPVYFNQMQKKPEPGAKPPAPKGAGDPKGRADPKGANPDENPKIETVSCYPAPADSTEDREDWIVRFKQVEFDTTGRVIKTQQLRAQEFQVDAQARDATGGQPYQRMKAFGPGELRIWQLGDKDSTGPGAEGKKDPAPKSAGGPAKAPAPPRTKPAEGEDQELKLTVVKFNGRMTAIDKGKVFQKATFEDTVDAVNFPSDRDDVDMANFRPPLRTVWLKCSKELIVWTHKKDAAPPVQRMDAFGNAYFRSDEHEGLGETINHDGKKMILTGSKGLPAQITNRFNSGSQEIGEQIIYDKSTGDIKVNRSFGSQFNGGGGGGGPKK
ncbi:hypothetical protein [Frigoriglobus tundricola]|uniref:Uncharacterized protein n=1 Tax=Frigoriglobus tundricola TaxID=2774151 RepID=A0A6M5YK27_9BACT|nr:hypothetical protein [Frigoriglobus tundricola]QJW93332.1 hypothetical protein FTUN_0838 [Frigoriglobus tundricola]